MVYVENIYLCKLFKLIVIISKMKKNIVVILLLLLAYNLKAQNFRAREQGQLYNYDFEEWVNVGTKNEEPYHWHSFKTSTGPFSYLLMQQIEPHKATRPGSTGKKSVHIFSRSIVGITANGNVTNGRMNAGSMFPAGAKNNNYTQRGTEFSTEIDRIPDSLTVWICLRTKKEESYGRMMSYVHGDTDLVCLTGGWEPYEMLCAKAEHEFPRTSPADGDIVWKRFSLPFESYTHLCAEPRYILTSFTTNKRAGEGNAGDDMFVDDVYLVYNPTLEAKIKNDKLGTKNEIEIEYIITGSMSVPNLNLPANEVIVQISLDDDFKNHVEIGRKTTDKSGTIQCQIPAEFRNKNYKIKVITTNYPMEFVINS